MLNNTVTEVTAQGTGYAEGIVVGSNNSVVESNRISTVTSPPTGSAYGIFLVSGSDILVSDNRISGTQYGIFFSAATGTYMNNLVRSSGEKYTGGTAAGTTNY